MNRFRYVPTWAIVLSGWLCLDGPVAAAEPPGPERFRADFLKLCDLACQELNNPARKVPFYQDSYAVRALAVAHDITQESRYLDKCLEWSNRMIDFQDRMMPRGAYYMNYGRKPGAEAGDWYVADCASIALGVLATGVRVEDPAARARCLRSVEAYTKLVLDNYVGPGGGITDGLWSKFDGEWWCSSGIFGSLALVLYHQTGNEAYRQVGLKALDWLNSQGFRNAKHIDFKEAAPSVLMYVFEAYSAAMPCLDHATPRYEASLREIRDALAWMAANQQSRGAPRKWDYSSQWGSKLGGLPCHMLVFARYLPDGAEIGAAADKELEYIARTLAAENKPGLSQLAAFAMMSYAERLKPGTLYYRHGVEKK